MKLLITGENELECSSRRSSSLSHRCSLCVILGLWMQQHMPIWFSEKKKRTKDLNAQD